MLPTDGDPARDLRCKFNYELNHIICKLHK
jgi:hypothetical protein